MQKLVDEAAKWRSVAFERAEEVFKLKAELARIKSSSHPNSRFQQLRKTARGDEAFKTALKACHQDVIDALADKGYGISMMTLSAYPGTRSTLFRALTTKLDAIKSDSVDCLGLVPGTEIPLIASMEDLIQVRAFNVDHLQTTLAILSLSHPTLQIRPVLTLPFNGGAIPTPDPLDLSPCMEIATQLSSRRFPESQCFIAYIVVGSQASPFIIDKSTSVVTVYDHSFEPRFTADSAKRVSHGDLTCWLAPLTHSGTRPSRILAAHQWKRDTYRTCYLLVPRTTPCEFA